MDKKKEANHETESEKKQQPKSDHSRPWLKLLPAAAVFAAVCVTCYQAEKTPVQTVEVSDADIISTADIKSMLALEDSAESAQNSTTDSDKNSKNASGKNSKKTSSTKKKTSKIKTGTKKNTSAGAAANGAAGAAGSGGGAGTTYTPTTEVPQDGYVDGTYTGSGTGFGGTITVQVTVSNHQIASINIVDASSETATYFANAQGVISKILASQSPNVDAVSGATYSSNGIIQAVQNALSKAMPSGSQTEVTPTPEATPTPDATPTPKPTKKPVPTPKPGEEQLYKDGTYTGTGKGYSGTVILTAKIKKGVITSLDVKHSDTPMFFDKAWEVMEDEIIQNQTTEGIDTVSGATFSSKGILSAMKDILKQAKKGTAKPTPTPEPTVTPKPTATPTPIPTATPKPTATPAPEVTETPEVTPDPDVTPTPEPTQSPDKNPDITPTPTPEETPEPTPEPLGSYRDGTYSGSSYGYSGKVTVTVTISGGQIVSLEQTNKDSPEFFEAAWGTLNPQILANQSADGIDTVSGATFSSEGILGAARKALAQAAV